MNTYYEIIATFEGEKEVLFGSFVKADCTNELQAERDSWKSDGYKGIKIVSKQVEDEPDKEVYKGELMTSKELWMNQAPCFNFELDEEQLLERALEVGFVTETEQTRDNQPLYLINQDY